MEKQGRRHHRSPKLFHHSVSDCSFNASDDGLVDATNNTSSSNPSIPIPIPIKQLFRQTREIKEMDFFSDNNIMNDDADDDEEPRRQPQQDCNNNPPAVNVRLYFLFIVLFFYISSYISISKQNPPNYHHHYSQIIIYHPWPDRIESPHSKFRNFINICQWYSSKFQ